MMLYEAIRKGVIIGDDWKETAAVLPSTAARNLISLTIDQSQILKSVKVIKSPTQTYYIRLTDVGEGLLTRVAEGSEPTNTPEVNKIVRTLQLLPVQLFYDVGFSLIQEWGKQAEQHIVKEMAKRFANDLTKLAFEGTSDNYDGTNFNTLAKGWLQIAEESSTVHKVNFTGLTTWTEKLDAVLNAMPSKWREQTNTVFIMNPADYDAFVDEVGSMTGGISFLIDGKVRGWKGRKIITVPYMPSGKVLFTRLDNIIFAISTQITRAREISYRKRVVSYTTEMHVDYEYINHDAVVIGRAV